MKPKTNNSIRYIVFFDDGVWYAAALELGVVVDADQPEEAFLSLTDAIKGVMKARADSKYEGKTFYTPPIDPEHESLWQQAQSANTGIASPYQIFSTGLFGDGLLQKAA